MVASAIPNEIVAPASRHACLLTRPATARAAPRQPTASRISAAAHSRSVVTAAGGIWLNSRLANPAPACTETAPARTSEAG